MGRRLRIIGGLFALAEIVVFVLVAQWIGVGSTILLTVATSALGWYLLARQGIKALGELRDRAMTRRAPGRELGDAGLVAAGGLLMVLPGFIGDVLGLLCLLPVTRRPLRALLGRLLASRLPDSMRGPVRVRSARSTPVYGPVYGPVYEPPTYQAGGATRVPVVIEGEVLEADVSTPHQS